MKTSKTRGNSDTDDITKVVLSSVNSFSIDITGTVKSFYLVTSAGLRLSNLTVTYQKDATVTIYSNYCTTVQAKAANTITVTGGTTQNIALTGAGAVDELTLSASATSGDAVNFAIKSVENLVEETDFSFEDDYFAFYNTYKGVIVVTASVPASATYEAAEQDITINVAGDLRTPEYAFSATETLYMGSTITVDDDYIETDGTVSLSTSDAEVASVNNETKVITPVAPGTCTITIATSEGTYYAAGSMQITLTVAYAKGSAQNPYTVEEAKDAIDNSGNVTGVYVAGIVSQVDEYNSTYRSITYWISDDGTTTDQFEVYSGKDIEGADFSSIDDVQEGDVVIVKGDIKLYSGTYEFSYNSQLVSLSRKEAATITVTGGTEQSVDRTNDEEDLTLTATANSGATVVFTLDSENTTLTEDTDFEFDDGEFLFYTKKGGIIVVKANAPAAGDYKAATEVTITITVIGEKEDVVFDVEDSNLAYGSTLTLVEDNHFLTDGDVTLTSSNTAVATVSGLTITPVAVGTTTITITAAESTTYKADSETFTLTVTAPAAQTTAYAATATTAAMDFTSNTNWELPVGSTNKVSTSTNYSDGTYTINLTGNHYYNSFKYLMLEKGGSLTFQAFDKKVTSITITGKSGASSSTKENIYVGETAVSNETTGSTSTNTFTIASNYQTVGTIYTLKVSGANAQITGITVTFAAEPLTATLNAYGYATYCSQYPLDFTNAEGYSAWQITGISTSNEITFERVTGKVKGGTGMFLKGEANATVEIPSSDSSIELSSNKLVGTLAPSYFTAGEIYGLAGDTFKKNSAGTIRANKAYIPAVLINGGGGAKAFAFVFDDDATGIRTVETVSADDTTQIFNLAGQRIQKMQRGINIVNGKKVMVK